MEDDARRARLLANDADLSALVAALQAMDAGGLAGDLVTWAMERAAERRRLADEALERYRELNLLYDLAEHSASLDPSVIAEVATSRVVRICRRGVSVALVTDRGDRLVRPIGESHDAIEAGVPADGFPFGEGIVGGLASSGDGEIVNDPATDGRATTAEKGMGPLMVAPLVAGDHRFGVLLVTTRDGADFTAGEHRMLSAVAALTAPALDAAITVVRTIAQAQERQAELERQLEELRSEVIANRREELVSEITGTEYFKTLLDQADAMRRSVKGEQESNKP
jgi:GAF domain-containing protein